MFLNPSVVQQPWIKRWRLIYSDKNESLSGWNKSCHLERNCTMNACGVVTVVRPLPSHPITRKSHGCLPIFASGLPSLCFSPSLFISSTHVFLRYVFLCTMLLLPVNNVKCLRLRSCVQRRSSRDWGEQRKILFTAPGTDPTHPLIESQTGYCGAHLLLST